MDSGDPTDPDKITSSNFASVCVKMVPRPPPAGAGPIKPTGKIYLPDTGEGSLVETVKTRSTKTLYSTEVGSKAHTQKSGGGGSSKRSASAKSSLTDSSADGGGAAAPSEPPVERVLSQLYTNKDCSWGFEKLFDLGKMFDFRTGYIADYG